MTRPATSSARPNKATPPRPMKTAPPNTATMPATGASAPNTPTAAPKPSATRAHASKASRTKPTPSSRPCTTTAKATWPAAPMPPVTPPPGTTASAVRPPTPACATRPNTPALERNKRYEYDTSGRLRAVRDANGQLLVRYRHDPLGRRIEKTTYDQTSNPASRIYFLYSDAGLSGEYTPTGDPVAIYGYTPRASTRPSPYGKKPNTGMLTTTGIIWAPRYGARTRPMPPCGRPDTRPSASGTSSSMP